MNAFLSDAVLSTRGARAQPCIRLSRGFQSGRTLSAERQTMRHRFAYLGLVSCRMPARTEQCLCGRDGYVTMVGCDSRFPFIASDGKGNEISKDYLERATASWSRIADGHPFLYRPSLRPISFRPAHVAGLRHHLADFRLPLPARVTCQVTKFLDARTPASHHQFMLVSRAADAQRRSPTPADSFTRPKAWADVHFLRSATLFFAWAESHPS